MIAPESANQPGIAELSGTNHREQVASAGRLATCRDAALTTSLVTKSGRVAVAAATTVGM
jgi:hypothetical protein